MNEDEVVRLTNLLAAAVKFSNITQREVERKLGLSSGSLSRLFSGGIELKVKHILDVCEVIGFPASRFFHAAYPQREEESGDAWRLQRLLEQLHPAKDRERETSGPQPEEMSSAAQSPTQADIERMVMAALGKFFSEMGKPSPS
ncbi:MAG TPA: helix-turn-helix transcriptional regulator [Thermoanaerobaculia bacterium]|nr:helix-turn-helix transcriptional regulator [Thermoanaerobaculia bacterium]